MHRHPVGAVYNACDVLVMQVCFLCVTGGFEHSQCLSRQEETHLGSDMRQVDLKSDSEEQVLLCCSVD